MSDGAARFIVFERCGVHTSGDMCARWMPKEKKVGAKLERERQLGLVSAN